MELLPVEDDSRPLLTSIRPLASKIQPPSATTPLQPDSEALLSHENPTSLVHKLRQKRPHMFCCGISLIGFFLFAILLIIILSISTSDHHDTITPIYGIFNATIYAAKRSIHSHTVFDGNNNSIFVSNTAQTMFSALSSLSIHERELYDRSQIHDQFDFVTAIIIGSNGRIIDVGYDTIMHNVSYASIPQINMNHYSILPGFSDAHGHIFNLGLGFLEPDLRNATSLTQINEQLLAFVQTNGLDPTVNPGYFTLGGLWDQTIWEDDSTYGYNATNHPFPTKTMLDQHFPEFPLVLERVDLHAVWCNSAALRMVTIPDTDPDGGQIIRDENGDPTGIFLDNAADIFLLSPYAKPTEEMSIFALTYAIRVLNSYGITMTHDASILPDDSKLVISQLARGRFMVNSTTHGSETNPSYSLYDPLGLRIYGLIDVESTCGATNYTCPEPLPFGYVDFNSTPKVNQKPWVEPKSFPTQDDPDVPFFAQLPPIMNVSNGRVAMQAAKLLSDGALGSWGAYLAAPYSDNPNATGLQLYSSSELLNVVERIAQQGFQIGIHAIGDGAVNQVLNTFDAVLSRIHPHHDGWLRRHRVEHMQIIPSNYSDIVTRWGIIPSMQPIHAIEDRTFASDRLGPERLERAYAWNELHHVTGSLPFGTDYPVASPDTLANLYAGVAMNRIFNHSQDSFLPQHVLTPEAALVGYTRDPAFAAHREDQYGTISQGMIADFIILNQDLLSNASLSAQPRLTAIPPENAVMAQLLENTTILATFVDGNAVFEHKRVNLTPVSSNTSQIYNFGEFPTTSQHVSGTLVNDDHRNNDQKQSHWYATKLPIQQHHVSAAAAQYNFSSEEYLQSYHTFLTSDLPSSSPSSLVDSSARYLHGLYLVQSSFVRYVSMEFERLEAHNDSEVETMIQILYDSIQSTVHPTLPWIISSPISQQIWHYCKFQTRKDQLFYLFHFYITTQQATTQLQSNIGTDSHHQSQMTLVSFLSQFPRRSYSFQTYSSHTLGQTVSYPSPQTSKLHQQLPEKALHRHAPKSTKTSARHVHVSSTHGAHNRPLLAKHIYPNGFRARLPPCVVHSCNREYIRRATFVRQDNLVSIFN